MVAGTDVAPKKKIPKVSRKPGEQEQYLVEHSTGYWEVEIGSQLWMKSEGQPWDGSADRRESNLDRRGISC